MRLILAAAAALLRQLGAALIMIGSVTCADLVVVAHAEQRARTRSTPETPLTPDEERAWTDLLARLVPNVGNSGCRDA